MLAALVRIHAVHHAYIRTIHLVHDGLWKDFNVLSRNIGFFPFINCFNMFFGYFVFDELVLRVELSAAAFFIGIQWFLIFHIVKK